MDCPKCGTRKIKKARDGSRACRRCGPLTRATDDALSEGRSHG